MNSIPQKKDDILKKIITSGFQESTPANFTNDVLSRLNISSVSAPIKYGPIIPFKGWVLITAIVTFMVYLSSFGSNSSEPSNSIVGIQFQNLLHFVLSLMSNGQFIYYTLILSLAILAIMIIDSFYRRFRLTAS